MMIENVAVTAIEICVVMFVFSFIYGIVNVAFNAIASAALKHPGSRPFRLRRKIGSFLLLLCAISCAVIVSINGYIFSQGNRVLSVQLKLLDSVPPEFWQTLLISSSKCLLFIILVKLLLPGVRRGIRFLGNWAKDYDQIKANDESIELFFAFLSRVISTGIWLGTTVICTQILQVPLPVLNVLYWIFGTYLILIFGILLVRAIPILIDTLNVLMVKASKSDSLLRLCAQFQELLPVFKRCLELMIYVGTASIILQYTEPVSGLSRYAFEVIGIIGVYFLVCFFINLANVVVDEFVQQTQGLTETQQQRRLTVAPLIKNCLKYTVYFGAVVAILGLVHIDPTPILAGAGILGIAVGFGAQNLINDIVSGFFILFENYYLVGDYIEAGRLEDRPIEGTVEAIELRTTQVRHPDGQLQIVRNGEIGSVVNYSKQYIYARVDIPLAYDTDLDDAYAVVAMVGLQLQLDYPDIVIDETQIDGLERFGKSLILVRTSTKVKPGQHLSIQRILRKMLKEAFDQSNIQLSDFEPSSKFERP